MSLRGTYSVCVVQSPVKGTQESCTRPVSQTHIFLLWAHICTTKKRDLRQKKKSKLRLFSQSSYALLCTTPHELASYGPRTSTSCGDMPCCSHVALALC